MSIIIPQDEAVYHSESLKPRGLLKRISPAEFRKNRLSPYFWGQRAEKKSPTFSLETGYREAREIIGNGTTRSIQTILERGQEVLNLVFDSLDNSTVNSKITVVPLRLSDELQQWRDDQLKLGRILPHKGDGLLRTSQEAIELLGAQDWAEPLLTNGALYGSGFANFFIGAYDAETLYSNYAVDVGFFYEHGYHKIFPEFEMLVREALEDPHARGTLGGKERRDVAGMGLQYIKNKVMLEEKYKAQLTNMTARLNRRDGYLVYFCDSSILGMAGEALARGYDKAGVMNDFAFSNPGTDIVDVGSDIYNSELFNSILNTADITKTGIITEDSLRCVYDAYSHAGAKMFNQRWSEPGARMVTALYSWHIQDSRHEFLRRALLGYPMRRKYLSEQQEADWCEAFDSSFHTTGFSRPMKDACNGADPCDQVKLHLDQWGGSTLLADLWWLLSTRTVEYASKGVVSSDEEKKHAEELRLAMARAYSLGLVDEMTWLVAHANHHAWQVNYLYEAAMFGSLLDDGGLKGKLDRSNI
ncbi:hypothetical protein BGW36DRAFT_354572 [Talaromyces proteolyticus]|uniref:Uncharacterized protein n=1 Tax=Talaromyces proteolyticus TaxID=1131652 RepID=A0AAD4KYT9_9EURO|nr:uncharacterized protein BGW36DRAFT_354572 [Talaromyces proteolyticus]KAH8703139.1 hypothetical protein BGW36DRAFT_354572 [Talaromyces proteolyticus]